MAADPNNDEYGQYNDDKNDGYQGDNNNQSFQGDNNELFETNWKDKVESFEDMGLKEELLRGIFGHGFETPSAIQQRGIIPVIKSLVIIYYLLSIFNHNHH